MSISEQMEEPLKELYGVVEAFINNKEIGLDDAAKERNLEAMGMIVDGVQLMADGLEQMDPLILQGLTESFVNALMSNMSYHPEDFKTFVGAFMGEQDKAPSWALEKMPEIKPESKPQEKGED